ncbi:phosphatase PAP2 family protein [Chryseomicrobium palamuruense]|uniref:Phosphatase PAP2 family protein n=1 Tax=Chryseomicrobium palamuruense TaxID=682973 RepID=A0ABV8UVC6_9BACL
MKHVKQWKYILAIPTLALFFIFLYYYIHKDELSTDRTFNHLFEGNIVLGFFSIFADPPTIIIASLLLLVYLWVRKKNYRGMLFVLFAVGGGNVVNQMVKNLIDRERPELENQLLSYSFPSGHAMTGLIYLFTIAYFMTAESYDRKRSIIIWGTTLVLALLIGLSRVANIHHYGSDVVAGWALGYTWFALIMWWYEHRKRQFQKQNKAFSG